MIDDRATVQGFQLSPQQRQLWLRQHRDGAAPYQVQGAWLVEGELERHILENALRRVVERHEILRTTFESLPGMDVALQVVRDQPAAMFEVATSKSLSVEQATSLLAARRRDSSDLERGPLLRVDLVGVESKSTLLLLSLPALCSDVKGLCNLVREIGRACADTSAPAAEPIQYADLAEWQNELLTSEETAPGREYWQGIDLTPGLACELPFGRESATEPRFSSARVPVEIPARVMDRIEVILARHDIPAPVFFLTCWQILLGRLCEAADTLVGAIFDGRKFEELEDALGLFARHLPVAVACAEHWSFIAIAKQTQAALEKAGKWQESFSCQAFQQASSGQGIDGPFAYCFEYQELPARVETGDLSFSLQALYACIERFVIKLSWTELGDRRLVELAYDPQRLDAAQVERLAGQFRTLVECAAGAPDRAIGGLDVLSNEERQQLVVERNRTTVAYPGGLIHGLFEQQAARRPKQVAVVCECSELTFEQLNARANQLAHHLRALGVGPDQRVAVLADRSPRMLIAFLGILKAGGACVPLDATLPAQRLAALAAEIRPRVLLSAAVESARLPKIDTHVVCEQRDADLINRHSRENLPIPAGLGDQSLAYVLFTSGSTGRPKGVAVGHSQLVNYVSGVVERLGLEPGSDCAMVSTFTADLGHTMLFPSLLIGGCLHVISEERMTDPEALAEYFSRCKIDALKIVPSHLRAMLNAPRPERVLPRRWLVLGGERLELDLLAAVRRLAPDCRVFNHYGPTEATVGATVFPVAPDSAAPISLGHPLPNCEIYVLSSYLQPTPLGLAGELAIGGAGLARGYFCRRQETAEKFVPQPFGEWPGMRLYKTGDRVRDLADGTLEFLGRCDLQVKIRGFRVEPREVECAVAEHPGVAQVVVDARPMPSGESRLVAYVIAEEGAMLTPEVLKQQAQERLPDYMVPAVFVELEALPLTANGKLDRGALKEPEQTTSRPPRTQVEELLAGLEADLLGLEMVGLDDNFQTLGGHSLLAMQLISRIREVFGIDIQLRSVLEAPTLAALADEVEAVLGQGTGVSAPPVEPVDRGLDLPLSFAQERHWFLHQLDPNSPLFNVRGAVHISGSLRPEILAVSFGEIVRRHEILRTAYPAVSGSPVQRITDSALELPCLDLRRLPAARRQELAASQVAAWGLRPFELERPPLLRVLLLWLTDEEFILALSIHHIVADHGTITILISELTAIYPAFAQQQPSPLPPLEIQYADFARWQREWLRDDVLASQLAYWRERLAGAPPLLDLSIARPRPSRHSGRSGRQDLDLSEELRRGLELLSRVQGATLFQTLLAVFQVLLHEYSGADDLVVGAPISSRDRKETEGLLGCFINALALRTRLDGNPSFIELLARVRETVLGACSHQELPFERVVQDLNPERSSRAAPVFQVVLNFAAGEAAPATIPGLELSPWGPDNEMSAKYDLTLSMRGNAGGLLAYFNYSSDLFDAAAIERMAEDFRFLLLRAVEQPETRLNEFVRLLERQRRRSARAGGEQLRAQRKKTLGRTRREAVTQIPVGSTNS